MPDLTDFLFGATKKKNPSSDSRTAMAASTDAKWTRNCDAAQILKSMIENGEVAQGDLPKDFYKMRDEFQRYPLKTFRNGFYNMKRDLGFHLRENVAKKNKGEFYLIHS
jgi:hypothetical protein